MINVHLYLSIVLETWDVRLAPMATNTLTSGEAGSSACPSRKYVYACVQDSCYGGQHVRGSGTAAFDVGGRARHRNEQKQDNVHSCILLEAYILI